MCTQNDYQQIDIDDICYVVYSKYWYIVIQNGGLITNKCVNYDEKLTEQYFECLNSLLSSSKKTIRDGKVSYMKKLK